MRIFTTSDPVPRPLSVLNGAQRSAINQPRSAADTKRLARDLNAANRKKRADQATADAQRSADIARLASEARQPQPRASKRVQVGRLARTAPRRQPTGETDRLVAAWSRVARPKPAATREPAIDVGAVYAERNRPRGADATKPAPSTPTTPPTFAEMAKRAYGPRAARGADAIPSSPRGER